MTSPSTYDPYGPRPSGPGQNPDYPGYSGPAGYPPSLAAYAAPGSNGSAGSAAVAASAGAAGATAPAWPAGYSQPHTGGYQAAPQAGLVPPGHQQRYPQAGYAAPGPYQQAGAYAGPYAAYGQGKSKVAAGLLGIFLGWLGVHNFYLGYPGKGGAQLALTIVGVFLSVIGVGFLMILATVIWGFVEGVIVLCATPGVPPWGVDGRGLPLTS